MQAVNKSQLFAVSCLALFVTSLSVAIRAGIFGRLGIEFGLQKVELETIAATSFWGFPLALIIGGMIADIIGMKRLLTLAFVFHLAGIMLAIFPGKFSTPFWTLFFFNLLIGVANGIVEAACNPLVTALFPDKKTTRLNHFHLWFPAGIIVGTFVVYLFDKSGIHWQVLTAMMIIPTLIYGYLFSRLKFPVTERVARGISTGEMYKSLVNPLFVFVIICMVCTSITELFTAQWIDVLLKNVSDNGILILAVTAGVTMLGRAFAGPIVYRLAPHGVLLMSAIVTSFGLYILGNTSGNMLFIGAVIFSMGVCYFWPTMLGFVSEYLPKTGAVGVNLVGAAGALSVALYMIFMGGFFDRLIARRLPGGADLQIYNAQEATAEMKLVLAEANKAAAPGIINTTLFVPLALIIAFAGLYIYMHKKKNLVLKTV